MNKVKDKEEIGFPLPDGNYITQILGVQYYYLAYDAFR